MNARQRFKRLMSFQPVDRLPVLEVEGYEAAGLDNWRNQGLPANKTIAEHLGMDLFARIPMDLWPKPEFEHRVLHESETEIIETERMGMTVKRLKSAPLTFWGEVDHPVKTHDDWLRYKEHFDSRTPGRHPEDMDEAIRQINACENPIGFRISPYLFRLGYYTLGTNRYMRAFYTEPELIHEMFAHHAQYVLDCIRPFLRSRAIDYAAFAEDMAYKNGPHVSLEIYKEFWLPYQDPIVKELRQHGVENISFYSAGNIDIMIPTLLEHGFNATWPVERAPGMDPIELRKKYGRDLRMCGGFPIMALIQGPEAIDRELDHLGPLIEEGGFLPTIDDNIPLEVPLSSYEYYIERLKAIRLGPASKVAP